MKIDKKMKFYIGVIAVLIVLALVYSFFESKGYAARDVNLITKCTDSDGGKMYYTYGQTYGLDSTTKIVGNHKDTCDGNYVIEWYCDADWVYSEEYYCARGCLNGQCTYGTPAIPNR